MGLASLEVRQLMTKHLTIYGHIINTLSIGLNA